MDVCFYDRELPARLYVALVLANLAIFRPYLVRYKLKCAVKKEH